MEPEPAPPASVVALAAALPADIDAANNCRRESASDRRGEAVVEVHFGGELGHAYRERCIRVSVGARVRFVGPFAIHPIAPGYLVDGFSRLGPEGAFRSVEIGEEAVFQMPAAPAVEGYFCNYHVDEGMLGAVFVEAGNSDAHS